MADCVTSYIKNIVLPGHADFGKKNLAECMLFDAGVIDKRGSIAEGNIVIDYHQPEQELCNSIFSTLLHS